LAPADSGSLLGPLDAAAASGDVSPAAIPSGAGLSDAAPPSLNCSAESVDWPMFGQNVCNTASQANAGAISPDTVSRLTTKWVFSASGDVSATPAAVGDGVYVPDWGGMIHRVDAATGQAVWSKRVSDLVQQPAAITGFVSRTTPLVTKDSVVFGTMRQVPDIYSTQSPSAFLIAVDRNTGAPQWVTPLHAGHVAAIITGSPVLDGDRLYVGVSSSEEYFAELGPLYSCCTFRGSVVAVDVLTGTIIWRTYMIRDDVYFDAQGAPSGYAGAAVWSSTPAVDRKRRQLYVTTGNNYSAPQAAAQGIVDGNYIDAVVALDLDTGAFKWAHSLSSSSDIWTPVDTAGPDADFGSGANLFTATLDGRPRDLVGAGQKSGIYWALDADTGALVWKTRVGPGSHFGGIHWGAATDGQRIYVGANDSDGVAFVLGGKGVHAGEMTTTGGWSALDPSTGDLLWQVPDPALAQPLNGASVNGPVAIVNGVLFGGSMDASGTMFALDAASGSVLWSFQSGGTVYGGPAVAGGVVYWGSGYVPVRLGYGTPSKKLFAFSLP
jgi:polyvinyl alcohol dehydrogenase (cytochrome)